jgi:hypothetical protein
MKLAQLNELILQALEHERCGVRLYEAAVACALSPELQQEWARYLTQTRGHVSALEDVCKALGIDLETQTSGRAVARHLGSAQVVAIEMARQAGNTEAAQLTAAECIVLAETKDHLNWQLLGQCAEQLPAEQAKVLLDAHDRIEREEDEHLYHTKSWCRELWRESLGLAGAEPAQQRHGISFAPAPSDLAAE